MAGILFIIALWKGGVTTHHLWPRLALKNAELQLPTSGPRLEVMHPALCAARPAPHELRYWKFFKFWDCTTGTPPLDGLHICATTTTTTTTNFLVIINVGHMTIHFFQLSKTQDFRVITRSKSATSKKALEGKSPSNSDSDTGHHADLPDPSDNDIRDHLTPSKPPMDFLPTIAPPTFEVAKPPKLSDVTAQVALHQKSFGTSDPRTLLILLNLIMTGCGPFGLAITTLANNGKMGDDGEVTWCD